MEQFDNDSKFGQNNTNLIKIPIILDFNLDDFSFNSINIEQPKKVVKLTQIINIKPVKKDNQNSKDLF